MAINGRDKGNSFELDVAWFMSQWYWGTPRAIRRVPMSGGWSKTKAAGDLISEVDPFPWSIECKFSKAWHHGEWFNQGWGMLGDYWSQCVSDSKHQEKHPMLVFKTNGSPIYCAFKSSMLPWLKISHGMMHAIDPESNELTIMRLKEHFFKLPFQQVYETCNDTEIYPYSLFEKLRIKTQLKLPPTASDLSEIAKLK